MEPECPIYGATTSDRHFPGLSENTGARGPAGPNSPGPLWWMVRVQRRGAASSRSLLLEASPPGVVLADDPRTEDRDVNVRNEVAVLRLYLKVPGTDQLRKGAAAELRTMLAHGWHETSRRMASDHMSVRVERPVTKVVGPHMGEASGPRARRPH